MRNVTVTDEVRDYPAERGSWTQDGVVRRLQAETRALADVAGMAIGYDQGSC